MKKITKMRQNNTDLETKLVFQPSQITTLRFCYETVQSNQHKQLRLV